MATFSDKGWCDEDDPIFTEGITVFTVMKRGRICPTASDKFPCMEKSGEQPEKKENDSIFRDGFLPSLSLTYTPDYNGPVCHETRLRGKRTDSGNDYFISFFTYRDDVEDSWSGPTTDVPIDSSEYWGVVGQLEGLMIPATATAKNIMMAPNFRFRIRRLDSEVTYSWGIFVPRGWEPLGKLASEIHRLREKHDPRDTPG